MTRNDIFRLITAALGAGPLIYLIWGCENPIDHFTEGPDRGTKTVITDCPTDSTRTDSVRTCERH